MRQLQKYVSVMLALILLPAILAMAGCAFSSNTTDAPENVPPWDLAWQGWQGGVAQDVQIETAFATGLRLIHDHTSLPLPSDATTWLVTGSDWGVALVSLDSAGSFQDLVIMEVDTQQHTWMAHATSVQAGEHCNDGQRVFHSLTFPEPVCSAGTLGQLPNSASSVQLKLTSWHTDQHIYLLGHFAEQAQRPLNGTEEVTFGNTVGWLYQEHLVTTIVLPLDGQEMLLSACTAEQTLCKAVAQQQLSYRDEFVSFDPHFAS